MTIDITALRALLAAGTPGPWTARDGHGLYIAADRLGLCVADMSPDDSVRGWHGRHEDAALITAAVNALPELLDEVEQLRALVEEACERGSRLAEHVSDQWLIADAEDADRLAAIRDEAKGAAK